MTNYLLLLNTKKMNSLKLIQDNLVKDNFEQYLEDQK